MSKICHPTGTVVECSCQGTIPSFILEFPTTGPMVAEVLVKYSIEKQPIMPFAKSSTLSVWASVFLAISTSMGFFCSFPHCLCSLFVVAHANLRQIIYLEPHPAAVYTLQFCTGGSSFNYLLHNFSVIVSLACSMWHVVLHFDLIAVTGLPHMFDPQIC